MRKYTCKVLELLDEGSMDADRLARDLLMWLSEDEVKEFCEKNFSDDLFWDEEEEDE